MLTLRRISRVDNIKMKSSCSSVKRPDTEWTPHTQVAKDAHPGVSRMTTRQQEWDWHPIHKMGEKLEVLRERGQREASGGQRSSPASSG